MAEEQSGLGRFFKRVRDAFNRANTLPSAGARTPDLNKERPPIPGAAAARVRHTGARVVTKGQIGRPEAMEGLDHRAVFPTQPAVPAPSARGSTSARSDETSPRLGSRGDDFSRSNRNFDARPQSSVDRLNGGNNSSRWSNSTVSSARYSVFSSQDGPSTPRSSLSATSLGSVHELATAGPNNTSRFSDSTVSSAISSGSSSEDGPSTPRASLSATRLASMHEIATAGPWNNASSLSDSTVSSVNSPEFSSQNGHSMPRTSLSAISLASIEDPFVLHEDHASVHGENRMSVHETRTARQIRVHKPTLVYHRTGQTSARPGSPASTELLRSDVDNPAASLKRGVGRDSGEMLQPNTYSPTSQSRAELVAGHRDRGRSSDGR